MTTQDPQFCRLIVENLVIGERRITDLPESMEEAWRSCFEIQRAMTFLRRREDGPLAVNVILRPDKILIRWFATDDDLPAAEARFVLMLQGEHSGHLP